MHSITLPKHSRCLKLCHKIESHLTSCHYHRNARAGYLSVGADFLHSLLVVILGGGDLNSRIGRSTSDDVISDWCRTHRLEFLMARGCFHGGTLIDIGGTRMTMLVATWNQKATNGVRDVPCKWELSTTRYILPSFHWTKKYIHLQKAEMGH